MSYNFTELSSSVIIFNVQSLLKINGFFFLVTPSSELSTHNVNEDHECQCVPNEMKKIPGRTKIFTTLSLKLYDDKPNKTRYCCTIGKIVKKNSSAVLSRLAAVGIIRLHYRRIPINIVGARRKAMFLDWGLSRIPRDELKTNAEPSGNQ